MERACVLDYDLQRQLIPALKELKPLPSIYYPDFIAGNQEDRANNLIPKGNKKQVSIAAAHTLHVSLSLCSLPPVSDDD